MELHSQKGPHAIFGALSLADLKYWLANLHRTNHEEYTNQLVHACDDIAKSKIANTLALQLLDEIRGHVFSFAKELSHSFLHQSIDLPKESHTASQHYIQLWQHLGDAYFEHAQNDSCFKRTTDDTHKPEKSSITCLHRAIHSKQQILLCNILLYRNDEPGQWKSFHDRFSLSLQYNINEHRINDPLNPERPISCITDLYVSICLLRIANCNQLNQLEILTLWNFVQKYSVLIDIDREGASHYRIDFGKDIPPIIASKVNDQKTTLSLNFHELIKEIDKSSDGEKHDILLSVRLREHLKRALSTDITRKMPRHETLGYVEIAIGLSNAWLSFSHKRNLNSMTHFLNERIDSFENDANIFLKAKRETILKDNWDTNYKDSDAKGTFDAEKVVREIESLHKSTLNNKSEEPKLVVAEMLEHSATGFSLSLSRPLKHPLRNGDILAMREKNDDRFVVAVIRWIRSDAQKVIFGAEILSPNAACFGARAIPSKGSISEEYFLNCLLLPEIPALKQPAKVLLPSIPFLKGNKVQLLRDDLELIVKLKNSEQSSFSHSLFTFEEIDDPMQRIPIIGKRVNANDPAIGVLFL